jgi:hypothetical protein
MNRSGAEWCDSVIEAMLIALLATVWTWTLIGADNARQAQTAWNRTLATSNYLQSSSWQADDEAYADLISNAGQRTHEDAR